MRRNAFEKCAKRSEKMHQRKKEDYKTRKIQKILEELKGTKNISNVKSAKKRSLIPNIKNMNSETITTKGIANVFAELYAKICEDDKGEDDKEMKQRRAQKTKKRCPFKIPSTASREDKLEQLKNCSEKTKEKIRQIFNEILLQKDCTPKTWRKIRVQVTKRATEKMQASTGLFAVCLCPVYKLFATVPYARLALFVHGVQAPDQAGVSPEPQEGGSPDGAQSIRAALPGVECTVVHLDNRFHEGIRPHQTLCLVVLAR